MFPIFPDRLFEFKDRRKEARNVAPFCRIDLHWSQNMNSPDHDGLFRAVLDARRVLSEDQMGSLDPVETLRRLRAVLDGDELVHALDRLNRQQVSRLER
ncbi:hypothetical protein IVA79_08210 [Bradyrhizobium sp. 138]|uniref:hypothetical protein n=1 Tax=Bradyrhizobium sp. 138 TaxID=2782615 RepID=UPI001FF99585|nr:hypothetical protein [Bradyrhizobium sp. 138]MCK1733938.1 hypothetical protein [Bradyrhizobium sp. 138]